jgi:hypothetical protein
MDWPQDADGDVMRRLSAAGFAFDKPTSIDFNVDFEAWPPNELALAVISNAFPDATITQEGDYVLVQITSIVSYEGVTSVQERLSALTANYGGRCDSWGLMQSPTSN